MTREEFFAALSNGAKWDVGVSIARTNPLPLDANSVFETEEALTNYIRTNALAYPGQLVVILADSFIKVCVIANVGADGIYKELAVSSGSSSDIDTIINEVNSRINSIASGETVIPTYALKTELADKETALKAEDTRLGGEITRVEGLIAPAVEAEKNRAEAEESRLDEAIQAEVERSSNKDSVHDTEILGVKGRLDTLESKISGVTGAMHFKGVLNELPAVTDYKAGDVIIVGSKEYVLSETGDETKVKSWVELGDENIHATKDEVENVANNLTTEVNKLTAKDSELKGLIDAEVARATAAEETLTTDLQEEVDRATGAEANLLAKITPLETDNTTNKSDIAQLKEKDTALDSEISGLKTKDTELSGKITALENASKLHALKTDVEASFTETNGRVTALEKIHETQDEVVNTLTTTVEEHTTTLDSHTTSITKNTNDIEGLTTRVTTAEGTIQTHSTDITNLKAKDTELSGKIATNTGKITTLEGNINNDVVKYTDVLILDGGNSTIE